jgi:hypothetical protein
LLVDWCRALVPSSVPSSAVITELQNQLLARERELDSQESDGLLSCARGGTHGP